ncbi:MAG: PD-(D/E)XK motif protein [Alphaproteobacteria bacterium]|nr:PD-(D/E)XK motif protein [Alphaproteobacteria bacterium]
MVDFDTIQNGAYRRIDENLPLLIEKSADGELSFVIETMPHTPFQAKQLNLKGITIFERKRLGLVQFVLLLKNEAHKEIFTRLCQDLADVPKVESEQKYINNISNRLEQWVYFWSAIKNDTMEFRKQMGLMGELQFFNFLVSMKMRPEEVLDAWLGPDKNPHDFVFLKNLYEVKARTSDDETISISNENQLEAVDSKDLLLVVYEFIEGKNSGQTILDMANQVIAGCFCDDLELRARFERKLLSEGLNIMAPCSNLIRFENVGVKYYQVVSGFPRIISSDIPSGILNVKYKLKVDSLTDFLCTFNKGK